MNAHPPSPDPSTPPGPPRRHAPGLMARLRRFAVDRFNLRDDKAEVARIGEDGAVQPCDVAREVIEAVAGGFPRVVEVKSG